MNNIYHAMFFIISKLLFFLVTPLFWIIGILIFALLSKNPKRKIRAIWIATGLLIFFTNSFILNEILRLWEVKQVQFQEVKNHDVGIVLGGMTFYSEEYHRIRFLQGTDRLLQAVDLYKKGKIKKILITGGSGSLVHLEKEAIYLKPFLRSLNIPEEDILTETESKNTHENAVYTAAVLNTLYPQKKPSLLVITSAFHMKRSIGCFEKAGLTVTPYSTDQYSGKRSFYPDHLLIPDTHVLEGWNVFLHELIGYATYKMLGYL